MDLGLEGKVALVTGGSMGIGEALVHSFTREGAKVAVCARGQERLEAVAREASARSGAEVLPVVADLTKPDDITHFVTTAAEHFGGIDILVNNCGNVGGENRGSPDAPFLEFTDEMWERTFKIIFWGTLRMMRAVIPYMQRRDGGRIVNLLGNQYKYPDVRKHAVTPVGAANANLTKLLSDEFAADGILINNVSIAGVITHRRPSQLAQMAERDGISEAEAAVRIDLDCPLGRSATAEEAAEVVVMLTSRQMAYMSGTVVVLDGGRARTSF